MKTNMCKITMLNLICASVALAATPSFAQLGGIGGALNTTINPPSAPDVRANVPAPRARVTAPASSRSRRYSDNHYHGRYAHGHSYDDFSHFHDDSHSHSHGYARFSAEIQSKAKDDDVEDNKVKSDEAKVAEITDENIVEEDTKIETLPDPITALLVYGTRVESKKGKDLGVITGLLRSEDDVVTAISVDGVSQIIPVFTLRAEDSVLVTSKSKKSLK